MTTRPGPWTVDAVLRVVAINAMAGVACVIAYLMVAERAGVEEQLILVNVAVAALVASGCVNVAWLLRGRRAVGLRYRELFGRLGTAVDAAPSPGVTTTADADVAAFIAGEGLIRYHRPGCALAAGRDWPSGTRVSHEEEGRQPCGVCRP